MKRQRWKRDRKGMYGRMAPTRIIEINMGEATFTRCEGNALWYVNRSLKYYFDATLKDDHKNYHSISLRCSGDPK